MAEGGTIFLDEIGEMGPGLQQVFLRVLEDGEIQPVGSAERRKVSVRIIAATNRNLEQLVREGKFREDLYYRINVVAVDLPPLRERREDIGVLACHFLDKYAAENGKPLRSLSPEALALLEAAPWPGNVRELENVIERAVLLAEGSEITPANLPRHVLHPLPEEPEGCEADGSLEQVGRSHIVDVLRATEGNKAKASAILGINRTTLWRMMQKLKIADGEFLPK
jgi:transcriptional regulator with PAS, ATPase and Fis domain